MLNSIKNKMLWNIMKYLKAVVMIIHTPAKLKLLILEG